MANNKVEGLNSTWQWLLPFALANGKAAALASGQCKHSPQALPFAKANGK
jgi:hypothetical protein